MKVNKRTTIIAIAGVGLAALTCANAAQSLKIDFSDESVGAEPKSFVSVVGVWRIENDGNNKVLVVDGRQWKEGQTGAGVADKARALYGERYAEFLDRVQAFAYYPYAVVKDVQDFKDGELSVKFEGISGRIDQGAGILDLCTKKHPGSPGAGVQIRLVAGTRNTLCRTRTEWKRRTNTRGQH